MELMGNMLLTVVVLLLAIFVACSLFILSRIMRVALRINEVIDDVRTFVSPAGENTPSPLASTIDTASKIAGHAIALEVKTTLMGKVSGASRLADAVRTDVQGDVVAQQMPLMGEILEQSPSLRRRLGKSPGLMELLLQYGPQLLGGRFQSGRQSGNGKSSEVKFSL